MLLLYVVAWYHGTECFESEIRVRHVRDERNCSTNVEMEMETTLPSHERATSYVCTHPAPRIQDLLVGTVYEVVL